MALLLVVVWGGGDREDKKTLIIRFINPVRDPDAQSGTNDRLGWAALHCTYYSCLFDMVNNSIFQTSFVRASVLRVVLLVASALEKIFPPFNLVNLFHVLLQTDRQLLGGIFDSLLSGSWNVLVMSRGVIRVPERWTNRQAKLNQRRRNMLGSKTQELIWFAELSWFRKNIDCNIKQGE
jgi:hypothetical protein